MPAVEHVKLHIVGAQTQPVAILLCHRRREDLILTPRDVHQRGGCPSVLPVLPVLRHAAADPDYSAHLARIRSREPVVQADWLRKAHQQGSRSADPEASAGLFGYMPHHLMMQPHPSL